MSFFCSCSSDLDFNQTKDLKIEPVFVANLAYFENKANAFIDKGREQDLVFDAQDFKVFGNRFFTDNLRKAKFNFEIENTINRAFVISFVFLDTNNQVTHNAEVNVPAYMNVPHIVSYIDDFENQAMDLLKKSVQLEIRIAMLSGAPLTSESRGSLKFRSGATLYLEMI